MPTTSAYIHTELTCWDTWTSQGNVSLPGSFTFQFPTSLQRELQMIHNGTRRADMLRFRSRARSVKSGEGKKMREQGSKEGRSVLSWLETFSKPRWSEENVFLEIFRIPNWAMQMLFMSRGLVCVREIVICTTLYTVFFSKKTVSGKYGIPQKIA